MQTKTTSEKIYDYVFHNSAVHTLMTKGRYQARITILGYLFKEYGSSDIEARATLANELSKSKFIQHNFNNANQATK